MHQLDIRSALLCVMCFEVDSKCAALHLSPTRAHKRRAQSGGPASVVSGKRRRHRLVRVPKRHAVFGIAARLLRLIIGARVVVLSDERAVFVKLGYTH